VIGNGGDKKDGNGEKKRIKFGQTQTFLKFVRR